MKKVLIFFFVKCFELVISCEFLLFLSATDIYLKYIKNMIDGQ